MNYKELGGICHSPEHLDHNDDRTVFFTRTSEGTTLVIVPKSKYKMFETDTTYILEVIK